jgi:hypothetical protein
MLCLHDSLKEQGEPFRLWVLCFDAQTEAVVAARGCASLVAIPLAELLAADPEYAATRTNRSRVEFYFTSTAVLVLHCLRREPAADGMTYLDADLFFFGPPSRVFAEQGGASVGIVPHRYATTQAHLLQYGRYNVGWVSFANDAEGRACLVWWRERCLEWCFDRVDGGRFADQGYLDEFPGRFGGVVEISHPGVNLAPWNVAGRVIEAGKDGPKVDGARVMFFHYQGVREVEASLFDPVLRTYRAPLTRALREVLYRPYLRELARVQAELSAQHGIKPALGYKRLPVGKGFRDRWERFKARWVWVTYRKVRGQLIRIEGERA